jgi:hypothetical protein
MTIDNSPAIRAFCQARIEQLKAPQGSFQADEHAAERRDELQMIVTLIDGLEKQNELLSDAMAKLPLPNNATEPQKDLTT